MSEVLILGVRPALELTLAEAVRSFEARGATVRYVDWTAGSADRLGFDRSAVRLIREAAVDFGPDASRRIFRSDDLVIRFWLHVQADEWTMKHAANADVLVALDNLAVYAVWQLAQINKRAEARLGLPPALDALERIAATYPSGRAMMSTAIPHASPRALAKRAAISLARRSAPRRLRQRLLSSPHVPASVRRAAGVAAVRTLIQRGQLEEGRKLAGDVAAGFPRLVQQAGFYGDIVTADIREGTRPKLLVDAYEAELRYADSALAKGRPGLATASFLQATRLAFHRAVHADDVESPLAKDPEGFTAPLQQSVVFQALTADGGRREAPMGRDAENIRVLLAFDNVNFLPEIIDQLKGRDDVELRTVNRTQLGAAGAWPRDYHAMLRSVLSGDKRAKKQLEQGLRRHLRWADVVFLDWCTPLAYAFTMLDPGRTRLVVRLHSYEAFTVWPHLLDYSRIDTMVFVSEHLRDLTLAATPRLAMAATRKVVISNGVNLRRCVREKGPEARFTLGLVGLSSVVKDVRWAVEVLRELRARDERYRLVLIGADLYAAQTAVGRNYGMAFERDLSELEPIGAIRRIGQTNDVPAALEEIGVILSTSVRESQHVGLLEGAASGAIPVVRDWPFFAGREHGPRTLFPSDWVVDDPVEAAERILKSTHDVARWRRLGQEASDEVIARFDITTLGSDYDRLFTS